MTSPTELLRLAYPVDHEELWRASGITQQTYTQEQQDRLMAAVNLRRYSKYIIRVDSLKKHVDVLREENQRLRAELDEQNSSFIQVPIKELKKLEQERIDIFTFIKKKLNAKDVLAFTGGIEQMWRVANTKKWDKYKEVVR